MGAKLGRKGMMGLIIHTKLLIQSKKNENISNIYRRRDGKRWKETERERKTDRRTDRQIAIVIRMKRSRVYGSETND
jgi:hypothetical protein